MSEKFLISIPLFCVPFRHFYFVSFIHFIRWMQFAWHPDSPLSEDGYVFYLNGVSKRMDMPTGKGNSRVDTLLSLLSIEMRPEF
jgi:hypothetical protein